MITAKDYFSSRKFQLEQLLNESKSLKKSIALDTSAGGKEDKLEWLDNDSVAAMKYKPDKSSVGVISDPEIKKFKKLIDKAYKGGGLDAALKKGEEINTALADSSLFEEVIAEHEKQAQGEMMESFMNWSGMAEKMKDMPKGDDPPEESKDGILGFIQDMWWALKKNASALGHILGEVWQEIWDGFTNNGWIVGMGIAVWAVGKHFGKNLLKILKFLKFLPGLSIFIDIGLAIKNVYYITKELSDGTWNETMKEVGLDDLIIEDPEPPAINYPNKVVRIIGEAVSNLYEYFSGAFKIGKICFTILFNGGSVGSRFDKVLLKYEKLFLDGKIKASEFAKAIAKHITACKKIKLVCSELFGLIFNLSSAIFDLAAAWVVPPIGVLISLLGNLVIAGLDMGVRDAIILRGKRFEDNWKKRYKAYSSLSESYLDFALDSDRRLSGSVSIKEKKNSREELTKKVKSKEKQVVKELQRQKLKEEKSDKKIEKIHKEKKEDIVIEVSPSEKKETKSSGGFSLKMDDELQTKKVASNINATRLFDCFNYELGKG